jgi:hypothetical protein
MTITDEAAARRALVERIKNILVKPKEEWAVIEAEPATIKGLYTGYVCILAAIGPVCMTLGMILIGRSPLGAMIMGVINYAAWLAGVYVLARITEYLAPRFGGSADRIQAFKVAAYSLSASALSGVFSLFPPLSGLAIVGLYSLYLLYLGAPRLMKTPPEKSSDFGLAVIGAGIVAGLVLGLVISMLLWPVMLAGTFL